MWKVAASAVATVLPPNGKPSSYCKERRIGLETQIDTSRERIEEALSIDGIEIQFRVRKFDSGKSQAAR